MQIEIKPLHPLFAAEVIGVDFSARPQDIPFAPLKAAIDRYGVLVLRNAKPPTDEQHVAFSRLFGPVEIGATFKVSGVTRKRIDHPALVDVSNLDADGNIAKPDDRITLFRKGDRLFHADMSFMENRATYSLLLGHEIPPQGGGGDTEFCDMRAAYDALPAPLRTMIDGLTAQHSIWHSRQLAGFPQPTEEELASRPPVYHPMVNVHPSSCRKTLYIGSHAASIVGWPESLGRGLIAELLKFATEPERVYRHKWRLGDLVMWDNLATIHRATDFEYTRYRRDMRRATCRERPVEVQQAA